MYYTPRQNGIAKENARSVCYTEAEPAGSARELVYCFWELKTTAPLAKNFRYIVVPDACIDIVFDLRRGAVLIMTPHTKSEQIDLGVDFHYVGIRLHPGVYQGDLSQIVVGDTCFRRIAQLFPDEQADVAYILEDHLDEFV